MTTAGGPTVQTDPVKGQRSKVVSSQKAYCFFILVTPVNGVNNNVFLH